MATKIKKTRFLGLGYKKEATDQWSFYDIETGGSIGPKYLSEMELLADVHRFAEERGYIFLV